MSNLVSKFYRMNPETDDMISNGQLLENGMIVLLEDSMIRADPDSPLSKYEVHRAEETNRWCEVSELEIRRRFEHGETGYAIGEGSPLVTFVGIYSDGVKIKRSYDSSYAWLVKKNPEDFRVADDLSELDMPHTDSDLE